MKLVKRTTSIPLIKYLFSQDGLYNQIVDDNHESFEQFVPWVGEGMYWFAFFDNVTPAGFARLEKVNEIMYLCHIAILKKHRKKGSEEWGKQVVKEAEKLGIKKLIAMSHVPEAIRYAKKCGAKEVAVLRNSFMKNGKLLDQTLLEQDLNV